MMISLTGNKRDGFTLMEMLIVVALFSLTVTMMAQTFATFNRLQRKTANRAVLTQEMRYVTELLTRVVRNQEISYDPAPSSRSEELRLLLSNGQAMIIKRSAVGQDECGSPLQVACILYSVDTGATWSALTGARVDVERFDVYVRPTVSPFVLVGDAYPSDVQPFVTVNIKMEYMATSAQEHEILETQTTVSSRAYKR